MLRLDVPSCAWFIITEQQTSETVPEPVWYQSEVWIHLLPGLPKPLNCCWKSAHSMKWSSPVKSFFAILVFFSECVWLRLEDNRKNPQGISVCLDADECEPFTYQRERARAPALRATCVIIS